MDVPLFGCTLRSMVQVGMLMATYTRVGLLFGSDAPGILSRWTAALKQMPMAVISRGMGVNPLMVFSIDFAIFPVYGRVGLIANGTAWGFKTSGLWWFNSTHAYL